MDAKSTAENSTSTSQTHTKHYQTHILFTHLQTHRHKVNTSTSKNNMPCSKCTGSKHHSDNCASTRRSAKAQDFLCYNCNGWGHEKSECTSPGGGAYESSEEEEESFDAGQSAIVRYNGHSRRAVVAKDGPDAYGDVKCRLISSNTITYIPADDVEKRRPFFEKGDYVHIYFWAGEHINHNKGTVESDGPDAEGDVHVPDARHRQKWFTAAGVFHHEQRSRDLKHLRGMEI